MFLQGAPLEDMDGMRKPPQAEGLQIEIGFIRFLFWQGLLMTCHV